MNPYGIPEIDPADVAKRRRDEDGLLIVDVREENELALANLGPGVIHMPLSDLAQRYEAAIPQEISADKEREIILFCHHGARSAQVAAFLKANGWTNVLNMTGGIHQYALSVDPAVGVY